MGLSTHYMPTKLHIVTATLHQCCILYIILPLPLCLHTWASISPSIVTNVLYAVKHGLTIPVHCYKCMVTCHRSGQLFIFTQIAMYSRQFSLFALTLITKCRTCHPLIDHPLPPWCIHNKWTAPYCNKYILF